MSETLTPQQTLMMWSLLAQGGRALQARVSPAPGPKDRAAMGQRVTLARQGRSNVLEMTDAGWAWASAHLTDELPPNFAVLHRLLVRLDAHFRKHGEILADFIGPVTPLTEPAAPAARKAPAPATPKATRPKAAKKPAPTQIKARIREAYRIVAGAPAGQRVLLSALRAHLPDLDRATLDEALTRIHTSEKTMTLMRLDNPKDVTPAEKAAELTFKGEPLHLLWIEK